MSNFKAKMHQNRFRLSGTPHTPLGELTALPRPSSWNKGDILLREWKGRRRREGREAEGRGEEGRGRGRE